MRRNIKNAYSKVTCLATLFVVFILIFCGSISASAQTRKVMNRPYIDQRRFHYGFLAGMQLQDLELRNTGHMDAEGNQWFADVPSYEPGFCVGILGEMYINKHLALRAIPTMHFGTKNVTFLNNTTGDKSFQTLKSTYISMPLDVKFSAERFNNYRPYLIAGIDPMYDLTTKNGQNLRMKSFDTYLEIGMGCDFYLPFFKFIPEVKFCYGLFNMVNNDNSDLMDASKLPFRDAVNSGKSKMIVISFHFE